MGYDGTVRIDSRLDPKGFNDGVKGITQSLKTVAAAIGVAFSLKAVTGFVEGAVNAFSLISSNIGREIMGLRVAFIGLQGAIVNAVAPAFAAIYPYLLQAISYFTQLFTRVAQISLAFFGLAASTKAAQLAQDQLNKSIGAGATASFDQLNVLAAKPMLPGIGVPDDVAQQVEDFKARMLAALQPLFDAFDRLKTALTPLGETIWSGLKWAWDNILVPLGKWVMSTAVPDFLDLVGAAGKVLNAVIIALQPMGIWLWDNFLKPLGEWSGKAFNDAMKWLTQALTDFSTWITNNQTTVQIIVTLLGSFLAAVVLVNVAMTVWTAVSGIAAGASLVLGGAIAFMTSPLMLVVLAITAVIAIIVLLVTHWDWVKQAGADAWAWIQKAWQDAGSWFTTNVTDPVKSAFQTVLDWLGPAWDTVFGSIVGFVKGYINSIIDFMNTMIQAVASGINVVINAMDSLHFEVPDWVPGIGGSTWGMNIAPIVALQIPRLATGAVIPPNAQFAAILGDQSAGRNIEAPEALIRQIIQEEMGNIKADISISFNGSLAALARELKPYADKESVRIGGNLIQGVVRV